MAKTDKELTAEIVIAHLNSWSGEGKTPTKSNDLPYVIELVYNAVHGLAE